MKKRILALLLVLSMLVSMVPTVFAADTEESNPAPVTSNTVNWEFWDGVVSTSQAFDQHFIRTDAVETRGQWTWENGMLTMAGHSGWATGAAKHNGTANDFYDNYTVKLDLKFNSYDTDNDGRDGIYFYPVNSGANEYAYSSVIWDQYKVRLSVNAGVQFLHYTTQFPTSSGAVVTSLIPEDSNMPKQLEVGQVYSLYLTLNGQTLTIKLAFTDETGENHEYTYVHNDWAYAQGKVTGRFNFTYIDTASGSVGNESITLSNFKFTTPVELTASIDKDTLEISETATIDAALTGDASIFANVAYSYTGYNNAVVTVDADGKVTAVGAGSTAITVTATSGDNTVSVNLPVEVAEKTYAAKIGEQGYETVSDAFSNAQNNDVVTILAAGTYRVPSGKSITIVGGVEDVKFDMSNAVGLNSASMTFENVTFEYGNANYVGLQHAGAMKYIDCTFNGQVFLYGTSETFEGCTFNQTSSGAYNVWTYGAKEVVFEDCDFNSAGKSVLIYSESSTLVNKVTVTKCEFSATKPVDGKAAIEMDSSLTAGIELTIDSETTATGFGTGSVSGNSLWNNKQGNEEEKNNDITVTVGGETVLEPVKLPVKVSTKAELTAALAAAQEGDTILMTADIDYGTDQLKINAAITLDLGGKTLTTRNAYGGMSVKNGPTIKNGTIVHASNTAAIKVWNAAAFEDLVIDVQGKGDANKTIGGIVLQESSATRVDSIKDVTIKGDALTNGIETYNCGNATENVIGSMENVSIDAQGTGMLISAPCGTATDCTIKGGVSGIEIWIKGTYSASLDLVNCDVYGGEQAVYAHDEFKDGVVNLGTLTLTADAQTSYSTSENGKLLEKVYNHIDEEQQSKLPERLTYEPERLNYVSIGDSMANGYCFEGYRQGDLDEGEFLNGTGVYGEDAYPLQFEEWLEEQGNLVNHTKLAPSAMRAEDLNYLLGGREMPQDNWFKEVENYTGMSAAELKEMFQEAVTEADIITMGVGNASFGAYMLWNVVDVLGLFDEPNSAIVTLDMALEGLDTEQKELILEVYNTLMGKLNAYIPAELAEQFRVEDICNIVAYTAAGFIVNYEGSLEQIVALNPDVEVVLVGLMNTTYGMEIIGEGFSIPVGDVMDEIFGALNAYVAALPAVKQANGEWADATFYYAEQPNPKFISQQFAALKAADWGVVDGLDGQIVRSRNIEAFRGMVPMINSELAAAAQYLTLANVTAFEGGQSFGAADVLFAFYLGFEDAIAASCDTMEIPVEALMIIATDISSIFKGFELDYTGNIRQQVYSFMTANDVMMGMCKVYALFKVGNGMSVHPTPAGHDDIAQAVINAYANGYTAEDATKDNAEEYAKKAIWLLTEYYDEIYALAYDKADEQGYIAAAVAALEYVKTQIAAINMDALELSDAMKAELAEQAALAIEAIEALQNLILTSELDEQAEAAAKALLAKLTAALENMNDILETANTDLQNAVNHQLSVLDAAIRAQISAAIERAEAAVENLKKYIDEDLTPAVRAEIEELIETIEGQLEYLQAVVEGQIQATVEQINSALAALDQAVTELVKAAQNDANQLLQAMIAELKALAQATVAEFEAALYEATHITMSIYEDQYYVSLGGATAYGAGVGRNDKIYSDLVVEALEAEGIDVTVSDCTDPELDYAGLVDYVKANAAEIAKATLITYNMDAAGFLTALFGNDPDWSAYFDEAEVKAAIEEIQAEVQTLQSKLAAELDAEALAALAQAEDDVLAALTEKVDVETARELQPYAEKLLYAAVSYAVETAKALEAIQTINPEAEIMLVGMYNPLAGTTLTVKGEVIDLGEMVEYAMEATDLYHLIYAAANDKVTFVDVSETSVAGLGNLNIDDPKAMISSLAMAMMNASAKISANAEGHAYIAEQIMGAIDFVGLLGDINLDGDVDSLDAAAALDAIVGKITLDELQKNNGDVNFDGSVDSLDAARILDYVVGKIQSFEE